MQLQQCLPSHLNCVATLPCEIQTFKIMAELILTLSKLKSEQHLNSKRHKNITMTTHMIFVQYVKSKMQIKQKRSEYDLMTNSVNCMQQTTFPLSKDDSSVCISYLLQSTYLINSLKAKVSA